MKERKITAIIEELNIIDDNIGIYGIIFEYQNIIYIGQSTNLNRRMSNNMSLLKHGNHKNYGFQERYLITGGNGVRCIKLCNCPVSLLRTYEKLYIDLFKAKGYVVFGDNITIKEDNGEITKMENLGDERIGLSMLDDRYLIILDEYSKYKLNKNWFDRSERRFTDFLISELENGVKQYNMGFYHNIPYYIASKIMKEDVNYVNCTLNYIAYNIILDIKGNLSHIKNGVFFRRALTQFEKDDNYRRNYIDNIIYRIKNNYNMNNDLIKFTIICTKNYSKIIENNDLDNVIELCKKGNIDINNAFDFLYYYILLLYAKKIVIGNYY